MVHPRKQPGDRIRDAGNDPGARTASGPRSGTRPDNLWVLVLAGGEGLRMRSLTTLGREHFPHLMDALERLEPTFSRGLAAGVEIHGGDRTFAEVYGEVPPASFSFDLLERAPERTAVLALEGVDWDDWGRPDRIVEGLSRIGKRPRFPLEMVAAPRRARRTPGAQPGPARMDDAPLRASGRTHG